MIGDGWAESAAAWIAEQGEAGDFSRRCVLDQPMLTRIAGRGFRRALDVGCGEGRFCRRMRPLGLEPVGLDATHALVERARMLDPTGDYRVGRAEALDFADGTFDLVVSYLTLIDFDRLEEAVTEMARVLAPAGSLLIANLTSFSTAGPPAGWTRDADGRAIYPIDRYLEARRVRAEWSGISVVNWHRPLETYMQLLLATGLRLVHFAEPRPGDGCDAQETERYLRVPWLYIMEWTKGRD